MMSEAEGMECAEFLLISADSGLLVDEDGTHCVLFICLSVITLEVYAVICL